MKWITELIGIVLCVQGIGGGISAFNDGGKSWFLVRHVPPDAAQIPAAVVLTVLGLALLAAGSRKRQDA